MASKQTVVVESPAAGVALVTLDHPPVNALDRATREALLGALDRLEAQEDVRAIVLAASGRVFCGGADIAEKAKLSDDAADYPRANRLTRDVFFAIADHPKPVIAAVQGGAVGAGCVLAACCDFIFAAETAFFALPEIDVGQGGGAAFLGRILPRGKMRRMALTGERVPAKEFYRLGAVEAYLSENELLPAAIDAAAKIAAKSPLALARVRGSFAAVEALGLRDGFRLEQVYTTELSRSAEGAAARAAFLAKRGKGG